MAYVDEYINVPEGKLERLREVSEKNGLKNKYGQTEYLKTGSEEIGMIIMVRLEG